MGNTLNYYRVMKKTLLEQRKKRIGPNDFKRNRRAQRDNDRMSLVLLGATVLFIFSATLSAQSEGDFIEAQAWKKECQRYFHFKAPRIVYYKDYAPIVWCSIESQKILKGKIPFDYKKDIR